MHSYQKYVCDVCEKESESYEEIHNCEAAHLGLTGSELAEYETLKKSVEECSRKTGISFNEVTNAALDESISNLLQFEHEYDLKSDRVPADEFDNLKMV